MTAPASSPDSSSDRHSRSSVGPLAAALNPSEFSPVGKSDSTDDWFAVQPSGVSPEIAAVFSRSLAVLSRRRTAGDLHDDRQKVTRETLDELATVGYWGLRVPRSHGGSETPLSDFYPFLTRVATVSATVAGLASVHGCIGAAGAVSTFGDSSQRDRWLGPLARGERYTAFALTEPQAGTDLTAIATRAERHGDELRISGEKMFISNLAPGRLTVLICQLEGQLEAVVVELPEQETPEFQLQDYGIYALRRSLNRGMRLRGLTVPAANVLRPARGNGLTVAYHGLNRGRVAVCAVAAGQMRVMLASLLQWVRERSTYGAPLASRELVRRRLARLAGLAFAAEALAVWCGSLLDAGARGEAECTVAKVFGSEALKEAAIELMMKTHGGRSFLHGHLWGDNLYDYLTPCVYEGEGEILSLALFRTLAKSLSQEFRAEEIGADASGTKAASTRAARTKEASSEGARETEFAPFQQFASEQFVQLSQEFRAALVAHGSSISDRQCLMVELSQRVQKAAVLSVVAAAGARESGPCRRLAAQQIAADLERDLNGRRPSALDFSRVDRLGAWLLDGGDAEWSLE